MLEDGNCEAPALLHATNGTGQGARRCVDRAPDCRSPSGPAVEVIRGMTLEDGTQLDIEDLESLLEACDLLFTALLDLFVRIRLSLGKLLILENF